MSKVMIPIDISYIPNGEPMDLYIAFEGFVLKARAVKLKKNIRVLTSFKKVEKIKKIK